MSAVLKGHLDDVMSVDFHPARSELASASYDGSVIIWDVICGKPLRRLPHGNDWVFSVQYSADGQRLFTTAGDGSRMWDLSTGEMKWHSAQQRNVSRGIWLDRDVVASSSADGSIVIHDVQSGSASTTLWTRFLMPPMSIQY
jgi:WD40 repeat protein